MTPEQTPALVGYVTLGFGAVLAAAPQLGTRPLGLTGRETAMRAIGLSDLALVPGLVRGRPRWPWMLARAAANLGVAVYLIRAAGGSTAPSVTRRTAKAMFALTAVDGLTGLALRRAGA